MKDKSEVCVLRAYEIFHEINSELRKNQSNTYTCIKNITWSDETHLILNSEISGFPNLSLFDVGTQTFESLTNEPYVEQDATSVPGTKSIVFSSNRYGDVHLWKFDPESVKVK